MMLQDPHSDKVIRCARLVTRQRRLVDRLRGAGRYEAVGPAQRLLHSFEKSLMTSLRIHRRVHPRSI